MQLNPDLMALEDRARASRSVLLSGLALFVFGIAMVATIRVISGAFPRDSGSLLLWAAVVLGGLRAAGGLVQLRGSLRLVEASTAPKAQPPSAAPTAAEEPVTAVEAALPPLNLIELDYRALGLYDVDAPFGEVRRAYRQERGACLAEGTLEARQRLAVVEGAYRRLRRAAEVSPAS